MKTVNNVGRPQRKSLWQLTSALVISLSIILSACSSGAVQTKTMAETQAPFSMEAEPTQAMMNEMQANEMQDEKKQDSQAGQDNMMETGTHGPMLETTAEPMLPDASNEPASGEAVMATPDWFSAQLMNVNNGETFTVQDLQDKVVLVETMAVWCTNCLQQQRQVKALHELLGERDDFVSLGLDIDPNENADDLKEFVDRNGFDWHYAIASEQVARDLGNLYGSQFLNPPSTPMLIVDRHGEVHPLPFGIKDAQTLMDALDPYLADHM